MQDTGKCIPSEVSGYSSLRNGRSEVALQAFELSLTDSRMLELVERYGRLSTTTPSAFAVLVRSVISQQISTKAADTIRERLRSRTGIEPYAVSQLCLSELRGIGLSLGKAECLRELSDLALREDFNRFDDLSDDEVTKRLMAVRGIGPWTVQMFLIFGLRRADVWPITDLGLRSAIRNIYHIRSDTGYLRLGSRFRPFRSYAARYLWKSLENTM